MSTRGRSESCCALRISVRMGLCFHICEMGAARAGPAKGLLPGLGDTHLVHPDLHYSGAGPPQPPRGAGEELRLPWVTGEGGCACGHPAELSHPAQRPPATCGL